MKKKIELEYTFRCSRKILFSRLSTDYGLAEWFADDVVADKNIFSFVWEDFEQRATLLEKKDNDYIRFQWEDDDDDFFEFRIVSDEVTNEQALLITDFVDDYEEDDSVELWNAQISELRHSLGV
ncbi:MAG: START-like domain-containing protein [Bacteroidales bacterium]|jgi:uncharacterized protein YndB with AHSA1/START domain|nr:START-like domain-containing protein [Bacteroidales bacterium]